MKKNVETIERVVKEEKVTYEAVDGIIFNSQEECMKYEKTAKCAIMQLYKGVLKGETNEYYLFKYGCDLNRIDIVEIKNTDDLKTVIQYAKMYCDNPEDIIKKIDNSCIGKELVIGWGYEGDWGYLYGTIDDILNEIKTNYNNSIEQYNK